MSEARLIDKRIADAKTYTQYCGSMTTESFMETAEAALTELQERRAEVCDKPDICTCGCGVRAREGKS